MIERCNPSDLHAPLGGYCHTIKVPAGSELVFVAGQVGADREGVIKEGVRAQTQQALANLVACLAAHELTIGDVVRLTVYLTDRAHILEMREERRFVSGLAMPELLLEINAVAARAVNGASRRAGRTIIGASSDLGGGVAR